MTAQRFCDIELELRSMRTTDDMPRGSEVAEYVTVAFKNIFNNLDFIQAASDLSYKICVVEVGFFAGKKKRKQYSLKNVPIDDTVEIFRKTCMTREAPDLTEWVDITKKLWP